MRQIIRICVVISLFGVVGSNHLEQSLARFTKRLSPEALYGDADLSALCEVVRAEESNELWRAEYGKGIEADDVRARIVVFRVLVTFKGVERLPRNEQMIRVLQFHAVSPLADTGFVDYPEYNGAYELIRKNADGMPASVQIGSKPGYLLFLKWNDILKLFVPVSGLLDANMSSYCVFDHPVAFVRSK